jgi:pimeloyl-ACP methyl ester carboxylesterase
MMEDVAVVLDAVESERAAILATGAGCFIACMFAATYPDRTAGIILYHGQANYLWSEETPWEFTAEQWDEYL